MNRTERGCSALPLVLLVVSATSCLRVRHVQVTPSGELRADVSTRSACNADLQDLERITEQLLPEVEVAAGARFRHEPRVRVASSAVFADALAAKFAADTPEATKTDPRRKEASDAWARRFAPFLIGFYSAQEDVVYFAPSQIESVMKMLGGSDGECEDVVRLVLAHDLTHALQQQRVDVAALHASCETEQGYGRLQTRIEGHASIVQTLVARKLGLGEEVLDLSLRATMGAVASEDRAHDRALSLLWEQHRSVVAATEVWQRIVSACGQRVVWNALQASCAQRSLFDACSETPACTACELRPETVTVH